MKVSPNVLLYVDIRPLEKPQLKKASQIWTLLFWDCSWIMFPPDLVEHCSFQHLCGSETPLCVLFHVPWGVTDVRVSLGDEEGGHKPTHSVDQAQHEEHARHTAQHGGIPVVPVVTVHGHVHDVYGDVADVSPLPPAPRVPLCPHIVRVDPACLGRDPDEAPEAVTWQHNAAHKSPPVPGPPALRRRYGRGVYKGEAEPVQAEAQHRQGKVGLDGEVGKHEAKAGNDGLLDFFPIIFVTCKLLILWRLTLVCPACDINHQ